MADDITRPLVIPEAKKAEFKRLTGVPDISWPVLMVAGGGIATSVAIIAAALLGHLSYWVAAPVLAFVYYWFFSVIHDGAHRSIAKNKTLNDGLAQLVISLVLPYANLELLRWAHMEHHRFTNDKDKDPDYWSHGSWYSLPLRWATIDINYAVRLFRSGTPASKKLIRNYIPYLVFGLTVIALLIWAGYGLEYVFLSFLPSRLMFMGIGFTFFWLPHNHWSGAEQELKQVNNYALATSIREGKEGLMNLLLQYQNYHLVHHMWPTTPFYHNEKVFRLLEPEFRQRDLVVARDYAIFPDIKPAA